MDSKQEITVFLLALCSIIAFSRTGSIPHKFPLADRNGRFIFIGPDVQSSRRSSSSFGRDPGLYSWPYVLTRVDQATPLFIAVGGDGESFSLDSQVEHDDRHPQDATEVVVPTPVFFWEENPHGWSSIGWVGLTTGSCGFSDGPTVTVTQPSTRTHIVFATVTSTVAGPPTTITTGSGSSWFSDSTCSGSISSASIYLEPLSPSFSTSISTVTVPLTVTNPVSTTTTVMNTEVLTSIQVSTDVVTSPYSVSPAGLVATKVIFETTTSFTSTTTSTKDVSSPTCTSTKIHPFTNTVSVKETKTRSVCYVHPDCVQYLKDDTRGDSPLKWTENDCTCVSSTKTSWISLTQTTAITQSTDQTLIGTVTNTDFTGSSTLTTTSTKVVTGVAGTVTVTSTSIAAPSTSKITESTTISNEDSTSINFDQDCTVTITPTVTETSVETVAAASSTVITQTSVTPSVKTTTVTSTQFTVSIYSVTETTTVTNTVLGVSTDTYSKLSCGSTKTVTSAGASTKTTGTTWLNPTTTKTTETTATVTSVVLLSTSSSTESHDLHVPATTVSIEPSETEINVSGTSVSSAVTESTPTITLTATSFVVSVSCSGGIAPGWTPERNYEL